MNYVPLYIKTHNSLLESMIKIDDLLNYAIKYGFKALTITDNNMYGVMDFYIKCTRNNIKPIVGLEVTVDGLLIILYAINYKGYKNLVKLSTKASEDKININDLALLSDNLICIVPFESLSLYESLNKIYSKIFRSYKNSNERTKLNGSNLIYMNNALYLEKEDSTYINYLRLIKDGKTIDDGEFINSDDSIKNYEYVLNNFKEDLKNNEYIFDICNLKIEFNNDLLPIYDCPNNLDSISYLKRLCQDGMRRIFGSTVSKVYVDRLKYELDVINKMGFCNYFLVVYDYVRYAKEKGILVGPGRGSAAGSIVSYLLNITTIDPIKYNLFFERFLNPERVTMPDIDIDFEYTRREEVINYCIEKYGIKKVAPIITFGTLGAKQAIRDVGRVMDIELEKIDYLCKLIDSRLSLMDNYNSNSRIKDQLELFSELKKLYKIATKFEGLKRHTSIHAAGIVISNTDLDEVIPLDKNHGDFYTTAYSMEYLEDLGLLKMDFLALKNLTLIKDVINELGNITFDDIPSDDDEAINVFTNVNTVGIFQFESDGMMNFLRKFKPSNFEDVVASIALFRPGPINNIDSYIKRKKRLEKIDYIDKSLENILKPTYGIIVYQEQIMQIAHVMAGYSLGEADILRRAMSKKKEDVLLREKDKFIKRSLERGYNENTALEVYNLILKFAAYGFNRAHSVAYSIIAYKMAYLKSHYPKEFMRSLLSNVIGSEIKTKEYIYESKKNNIKILKPDINLSGADYIIEMQGIRYPLTNIKGIGYNIASIILEERKNGIFKDIYDFVSRCYKKNINRKIIENLIDAGCFNSLGLNNNTIYSNLDLILNYGEIGSLLSDDISLKPVLNMQEEFSNSELMSNELRVFGFYLSNHPVTEYKIRYNNNVDLSHLNYYFNTYVDVIVYVDKLKEVSTKKNDKMLFITGSDEITNIDIVLFPKIYEKNTEIKPGIILLVKGKVEKRFDKLQIIANELEIL